MSDADENPEAQGEKRDQQAKTYGHGSKIISHRQVKLGAVLPPGTGPE
jgi:hypothetical protein